VIKGSKFRVQGEFGAGADHPVRVSILTSSSGQNRAIARHIVPSTSASLDDLFRAAKVSSMRTESGTSATGPIKNCGGSVDNFTDDVRLEKIDRLRKSLAENTYHVSSDDLAQKIIDHISDSPSLGEQES
jgi:anti-sigma28 factor (negative regulator of flagellin synthesis)